MSSARIEWILMAAAFAVPGDAVDDGRPDERLLPGRAYAGSPTRPA